MASTLRILVFGPIRAKLGVESIDIACGGAISPAELWSQLLQLHPNLGPLGPTIRLARGGEFLASDASLHPGEEIALIPPVSGG